MKTKLSRFIGPVIAILLLLLASRVLYRELSHFDYQEVLAQFSNLSRIDLMLACAFTAVSYLVLTFYDVLAIQYVGQQLPYYRIALASFIGYTLSHNLGFPLVTGGAARFRLFSSWGLSNFQIAQAIAFSGLIYWLGFVALGGTALVLDPPPLPGTLEAEFRFLSLRPRGILCWLVVVLYFYWFGVRRIPIRVRDLEFPAPQPSLSIVGTLVAALDWFLACNVAYVILPDTSLSYLEFLGLFQLGQVIGLLSHVPGGLGVFEATILEFLSDRVPASALFGSLIAYRIVYYLVPLAFSSVLLLAHEIRSYCRARLSRA